MIKAKQLDTGCLPFIEGYLPSQNENPTNGEDEWDFFPEEVFYPLFKKMEGQHRSTKFGETIFLIASEENGPKKWIEVGAWNGKGTTLCLLNGIQQRDSNEGVEIISYEADPFMYQIAKENLEYHPYFGNSFHLIFGRLPCSACFLSSEVLDSSEKAKGGHYFLNFERERHIFQRSSQVPPTIIADAVILDGGEYTGRFDWDALDKTNLQYIFLDDVGIFKHKSIYKELMASNDWLLFEEKKDELNGWAIFKRRMV
jgi:hypothetical protein